MNSGELSVIGRQRNLEWHSTEGEIKKTYKVSYTVAIETSRKTAEEDS